MALKPPPRSFAKVPLSIIVQDPAALVRVTRFPDGEPFFGKNGANRFDDYRRPKRERFGTCYLGLGILVAFAETVLHDEIAVNGRFEVALSRLADHYAVEFSGRPLRIADCTGVALKRMDADGALSTEMPYDMPQRWSVALHGHPARIDGFRYVSRHVNDSMAVVLFDRVRPALGIEREVPLLDYPGALDAMDALGVDVV
jgi:hypothetical protein